MAFFGTDAKEKQASETLNNKPGLDSSLTPQTQAKLLTAFHSKEDDLTFREGSVSNVSDRGRARVVEALVEGLSVALKRASKRRKAAADLPQLEDDSATPALTDAVPGGELLPLVAVEPSASGSSSSSSAPAPAQLAASSTSPPWVRQDVVKQLEALRRIRGHGDPSKCLTAAEPLRRLAMLPIDSFVLKKTKVALELNQDFWKKAPRQEVRHMVVVLVRQWKAMYRSEQGALMPAKGPAPPSARSLRNLATDLEECAYGRAPKASNYETLVRDLLFRLEQAPDTAQGLHEGTQSSKELIQRLHKRAIAAASSLAKRHRPN